MSKLVFYEKSGCIGNQRQKALLTELGCELDVRDLLKELWTSQSLRPFFSDRPVVEWFNLSAPMIKSGEIAIDQLSQQQALALMVMEPLLIRRPLLQFADIKQAGFASGPVFDALGVSIDPLEDLQTCPMPDSATACEMFS
jgi:nitrogenase-associated protein